MAKSKKTDSSETKSKNSSASFFNKMKTKNSYAENRNKFDVVKFIDTGCYALNAVLAGDMLGGFPSNRMIMLAGEQAVGKSLFAAMSFIRPASEQGRFCFYFDTENAVEDDGLEGLGVTPGTYKVLRESTVNGVREQLADIVSQIKEDVLNSSSTEDHPKAIFVIDSQGNMVTRTAKDKTAEGVDTKDMSLQSQIKRLYAENIVDLGLIDAPLIVTNHVYANVGGYGDPLVISGGKGGLYNSSVILLLRKSKDSEGTGENKVRLGSIFTVKAVKSRYVGEETTVKLYVSYKTGLNRWYGVHAFAEKAEMLDTYTESTYGAMGVQKPVGLGNGKKYVLKHPSKLPSEWVVCNDKNLHTKEGIGSIFEPLNEWVKENFKLKAPVSMSLDDDSSTLPEIIED